MSESVINLQWVPPSLHEWVLYANVGLSNISSEQDTILDSSDTLYQGFVTFLT
jgi:hypothetical protein